MRPSPPFVFLNLLRIQNVLRKTPHIQAAIDPATSSNPNYIHSDYLMRALLIIDDKGIFPDEAVDLEIASWLREEVTENKVDKMIFDYVKTLENLHLLDPVYLTLHRLSGKSAMQCQKRYAILVFLTLFSSNNELSLMLKPLELWTIFVKITNTAFLDQLNKLNRKALVFFTESLERETVFRELCISPIIDDVCLDILLFTFSQLEKYGEFTITSLEKLFKRMIEFTKDPQVKTINEMRGMISHHCLLPVAQLSFWNPGPEFLEKIKKYSQAAYVFFQSGYSLSALMAIPSDKQDKLLKAFHQTAFVQCLVQNDIDPSEFLEFNQAFSKLIGHFSTIATINHNLISKNKVNWILKILNFKAFQTYLHLL